jgi:hypothetical protein
MVEDGNIQLDEITLADRAAFSEAEGIAAAYEIDLSDALQLITLKRGMFARLKAGEPILISEDRALLRVAEEHGLKGLDINSL